MKKPYKGTRTSSWKSEDKRGGKKFGGGGAWKRGGDHKVEGARSTRPGMHDATCGKCGKACQVPFRPTGERPIFCSTCFANGSGPAKFASEPRSAASIFVGHKEEGAGAGNTAKIEARLKAIEDKLDALIEALTEDLDDEDEDEEGETEEKA
jgi:CxxC-x17-CxxC domain-containing protein